MWLALEALQRVRVAPSAPSYMSVKQGKEETFASFVDRITEAINRANVQDWMKGAFDENDDQLSIEEEEELDEEAVKYHDNNNSPFNSTNLKETRY